MASARDMHTFTGAPVWYKAGVKKLGPEKKGIIFLGKHLLLDQPTLFARAFISACAFPVPSGNFILYFKFMRSADRLLCTPLRVQLQLPTSVAQMQFTRPVWDPCLWPPDSPDRREITGLIIIIIIKQGDGRPSRTSLSPCKHEWPRFTASSV